MFSFSKILETLNSACLWNKTFEKEKPLWLNCLFAHTGEIKWRNVFVLNVTSQEGWEVEQEELQHDLWRAREFDAYTKSKFLNLVDSTSVCLCVNILTKSFQHQLKALLAGYCVLLYIHLNVQLMCFNSC